MKTSHSSTIKLTVIMPLYNQQELFKIGLDSIPPRDDIEIIVIDDGSTDGSLKEARMYQLNSSKNVVVLWNDRNMGVAYTVNRGLDNATGEYVVFLGSDGDYFVNLSEGMEYLNGKDIIYFPLENNSGTMNRPRIGSSKFIRREFIGDIRNPLLVNDEDRYFHQQLMAKGPEEDTINVMYKHYNYPREGSLVWQVEKGLVPIGQKI